MQDKKGNTRYFPASADNVTENIMCNKKIVLTVCRPSRLIVKVYPHSKKCMEVLETKQHLFDM